MRGTRFVVLMLGLLLVGLGGLGATGRAEPTPAAPAPLSGPLDRYAEPVVITVANVENPSIPYIQGDDADNNIHTRINKDYLNIIYKSKWVADATKADDKINLAIASDDLPDVLNANIVQLNGLIKNGQIQDLSGVWASYPTDIYRKSTEYQNKVAFIPATRGGKLYGIPITGDFGESVPVMYIRKDWLDNVKMTAPKTMDELVALARAFVNDDPDKNGKKDTYAITLDNTQLAGGSGGNTVGLINNKTTIVSIAASFNAYPTKWIKDGSGRLVYGSIQPEMRAALLKMQELYAIGAFDPEFAVKDFTKISEGLVGGRYGIYFGIYSGAIDPLLQSKLKEPNVEWHVLPIPSATGRPVVAPARLFADRWMVVRKGYEHPEAIIKSMNVWYEMNYHVDSELYMKWLTANTNGGPYEGKNPQIYAKPYYSMKSDGNLQIGNELRAARDAKSAEKLNTGGKVLWNMIQSGDALGWAIAKVFYEAEMVVGNYGTLRYPDYLGAPTETMASKGTSLDRQEVDTFTKIIMGAPITEFDAFVTRWHSLGGDQILKELNASN